jgi:hypothetical protein
LGIGLIIEERNDALVKTENHRTACRNGNQQLRLRKDGVRRDATFRNWRKRHSRKLERRFHHSWFLSGCSSGGVFGAAGPNNPSSRARINCPFLPSVAVRAHSKKSTGRWVAVSGGGPDPSRNALFSVSTHPTFPSVSASGDGPMRGRQRSAVATLMPQRSAARRTLSCAAIAAR